MNKQTKIGLTCCLIGIVGFFVAMSFLNLFGSKIDYANSEYLLKMCVSTVFLVLSTFGMGYVQGGLKSGLISALIFTLVIGHAFYTGYQKNT